MSSILLVRHGQASFGARNYDELSALGAEQACRLAAHWRALGIRLDAVYSGTLRRQIDTARAILACCDTNSPPLTDAGFNEYAFQPLLAGFAQSRGTDLDWAAFRRDERAFYAYFEEAVLAWTRAEIDAGGESWREFQARCVGALDRVLARLGRGETVAIVTSGGPIGAMVQHLLGLSDVNAVRLKFTLYNASVSRLLHDGTRTTLASFNATSHLEHPETAHLLTNR